MEALSTYLLYFLAAYAFLTVLLFLLSPLYRPLSFYARLLSSYLSLAVCALYGVFASIALRLFGHGGLSQWTTARAFALTMRLTTGIRFRIISGESHLSTRPGVFIGNHQTELDVLLLGAVFPRHCSVTAKSSLRRVPLLGWFMALSGTVFIDRANRSNALRAFDEAADSMRARRQSVFIFPEGTRSYADRPMLLPFKKGAFHLAVRAQVPIVPVVAANYSAVLSARRRVFEAGEIAVKGMLFFALLDISREAVADVCWLRCSVAPDTDDGPHLCRRG